MKDNTYFIQKKADLLKTIGNLKDYDIMNVFTEEFSILEVIINQDEITLDEINAINYRLNDIKDVLGSPFIINQQQTQEPKRKKVKKYDQSDIRDWLEDSHQSNKIYKNSFLEPRNDSFDDDIQKAIEMSKDILNDDIELQLALEMSKNETKHIFDSMKIKTIDS